MSTRRYAAAHLALLLLALGAGRPVSAQVPPGPRPQQPDPETQPPAEEARHTDPTQPGAPVLVPALWVVGENVGLWAFDRYALKAEYAYIGLDTMAENLSAGFQWDDDGFVVNQFGHPVQGALYFATARAAGHGFWTSVPYVALGSLQWELLMETQAPALNDLITTTLSGVIVGEVFLRTAALIRDDGATGFERGLREVAATVLDPATGADRLFSGAAFRRGPDAPQVPHQVSLSLGVDRLGHARDARGRARLFHGQLALTHGALPKPGDPAPKPFDQFTASVGVNVGTAAPAVSVDLDGVLAGWPLDCGEGSRCLVAAIQHFDFYHSPVFQLGTTAVGGGFRANLRLPWHFRTRLAAELLGVALGGIDSPFVTGGGPPYNMGHGGLVRLEGGLSWRRVSFDLSTSLYALRTLYGARGREWAGLAQSTLRLPTWWRSLSLELGSAVFSRYSELEQRADQGRVVLVGQSHLVWTW